MANPSIQRPSSALPSTRSREIIIAARWVVSMRWFAGIGVLVAAWFARSVLHLGLSPTPLYVSGVIILAYNAALWAHFRQLERISGDQGRAYQKLTHLQVGLDWLAMAALIHFSGGIESPIIFFFTFHIILASLLFSQRVALIYTVTALALVGGVALLEYADWLPHFHVEGFLTGDSYQNFRFMSGVFGVFTITSVVTVYLTSFIAERLRQREEQLGTLYLAAQTVNSTLDLSEVLDRLVRATTEAMGVSAASIGLLDPTGTKVDLEAAYGLTNAYLSKGPILLEKSAVHTEVISSGRPAFIQSEADRSKLQYPNAMDAEGIRSMLYVRLQARNRPLGVVRVHCTRPHRFNEGDARFLSAMAAQGAIAIENAMAYQALKKLDLDKSQFVRSVTHELRSPVTGAQSLLRGVIKGYAGGLTDQQRDVMNRLNRRLDKLEALINDLLDLAAGRSDLKVEEIKPVSLSKALDKVMTYLEATAAEKRQSVSCECPGDSLMVMATEEGLDRIFVNLVGNAVKYTPEEGTIRVLVEQKNQQVAVAVEDSGIGIPEDSLSKLFSEFYRAPNAKAFETGTGLGLVIVKELVESFGGRISVESQEGKGTTFTVHLPLSGPTTRTERHAAE